MRFLGQTPIQKDRANDQVYPIRCQAPIARNPFRNQRPPGLVVYTTTNLTGLSGLPPDYNMVPQLESGTFGARE